MRAVVLVLTLGGCDTTSDPASADEATQVTDEIVANLRTAGFEDDAFEVMTLAGQSRVVLGGDAIVGLDASRTLAGHGGSEGGEGHAFRHFVSRQSGDWNTIDVDYDHLNQTGERTSVCVELGDIAGVHRWQALRVGLENATAAWNSAELGLGLQFVAKSWCSSGDGQKITLDTSSPVPGGKHAFANMPASGRAGSTIMLNACTVPSLDVPQATNLMMHMLGHTAGLHHTDWCGWASDTNESRECTPGSLPLQVPFSIRADDAAATQSIMATNFEGNGTQWTAADQQALRVLYSPNFCETLDGRTIAVRMRNQNRWLTGRGPGQRLQAWALGSTAEITEQQRFKVECLPGEDGVFALSTRYLGSKVFVARRNDPDSPPEGFSVISDPNPGFHFKRWRAWRSKGPGRPRWGIELVSPNLGLTLNDPGNPNVDIDTVVLEPGSKSVLSVFDPG
ncbi:MAG: M57 family metalloprotease [Myxococcota bacterium]